MERKRERERKTDRNEIGISPDSIAASIPFDTVVTTSAQRTPSTAAMSSDERKQKELDKRKQR
jgi:hypothetical protein